MNSIPLLESEPVFMPVQTPKSKPTKINKVLAANPEGVPMTSEWLGSEGVSPQLLQQYRDTGWLQALGRGCWIRVNTVPTLAGAIYALQRNRLNIYPAGRTSLELQGRGHYVPLRAPTLHLTISDRFQLPAWFRKLDLGRNVQKLNMDSLFEPTYASLQEIKREGVSIKVSSSERAILEYCQLLPKRADFEEARQLMEGLPGLRPALMQSTLQHCKSIKAKRLFLALAQAVGHAWFNDLNLEVIELGSSNRLLPFEGVPHPQFSITVPRTWVMDE